MASKEPLPDEATAPEVAVADPVPEKAEYDDPPAYTEPEAPPQPTGPLYPNYSIVTFSHAYGKLMGWGASTSPVTGNIAISDSNKHQIHILSPTLQPLLIFGSKGSQDEHFNQPMGICFAADGSLFVADSDNHRIKRVLEDGRVVTTFGGRGAKDGEFMNPRGVACANGMVFVADSKNFRVQVFKEDGRCLPELKFGRKGKKNGEFEREPWHISVSPPLLDHTGADTQTKKILITGGSGNLLTWILNLAEPSSPPVFTRTIKATNNFNPSGIGFNALGQSVVSDWSKGNFMILDKNEGPFVTVGLAKEGKMDYPQAVTLTPDGNIVIVDRKKNRVCLYHVPHEPLQDAGAAAAVPYPTK